MKAAIMDFNGTLLMDTLEHERAWIRSIKEGTGRTPSRQELVQHMQGKTNDQIIPYFWGDVSDDEIEQISSQKEKCYQNMMLEKGDAFRLEKGVPEYLDWLVENGIPFTLATSAPLTNIDFYFKCLDLGNWFDRERIVYDDGTLRSKPAPDYYAKAAQVLGCDPKDCVVFEDAVNGVRGAAAADTGCIVGYDPTGAGPLQEREEPDLIIESFHDPRIRDLFTVQKS